MTFREILDEENVPYVTEGRHCRPGWLQLDCPFCDEQSEKYHLGYSLEKNYLSCWRCGWHPLLTTLALLTGRSEQQIRAILDSPRAFDAQDVVTTRPGVLKLPKGLKALSKVHLKYLFERGLSLQDIDRWKLQGLGVGAYLKLPTKKIPLAWRIFIPIIFEGEVVSWTTRSLNANNPLRYISAPSEAEKLSHKKLLFGEDFVRQSVCCVEGPFDAMRIGPGAVATCGIGYSQEQMNRLSRFLIRGVCFDNEVQAQRRALKLIEELAGFPGTTYNIILDSKDPGSASEGELARLRRVLQL